MIKVNESKLQKASWEPLAKHCVDEVGTITRWYLSPRNEPMNLVISEIDKQSLNDNLLKNAYGVDHK